MGQAGGAVLIDSKGVTRRGAYPSRAWTARAGVAGLLALVVVLLSVVPAMAVPGVPQAPTVVYSEDFQNVPGAATNASQLITNYTSVSGTQYTASPSWLQTSNCNGIVANALTTSAQSCPTGTYTGFGAGLMRAMGIENGSADPLRNYGLTELTRAANIGTDTVQLQTVNGVSTSVPLSGRYVSFGITIAATTCGAPAQPNLTLALINDGTELPTGSGINPCTDPRGHVSPVTTTAGGAIRVGRYFSPGSTRVGSAGQLGFIVRNLQTGGSGNDIAFDDVQMLDATPTLDKSFGPSNLDIGQPSTLTFTITNTSDLAAKDGWSFTDNLPSGLAVADPANASTTCSGGQVTATAGASSIAASGNLDAGQVSCTVSVNVTSTTAGSYSNCPANVTTVGLNPPACTSVAFEAADLSIVKSASPSPVVPGRQVTYELVVTNGGPNEAEDVVVTDELPNGVSFVSASDGCTESNGTVTCPGGTLVASASRKFTITGQVASSARECPRNTARVSSNTADPEPDNNVSQTCPQARGLVDLSISKSPSQTVLPIGGGQVMYTLVVRNDGPSDASGVTVSDAMARGLTLVAADPSQGSCSTAGNRVSCDLGELVAGGSAQVLVTADTWATPGSITNTATVRGDQEETEADNNHDSATVSVPEGPTPPSARFDLAVDKRASAKRPVVGRRVTYRIVVRNNGPEAAPGVQLVDTLSGPAKVVSVTSTAGSCAKRIPMRCELGTIAAGERVTVRVVVKHRASGCRQRNAASATGAGTDTTPGNNLDVVSVCAKVALRVSKVASRSSVAAGGTLSYTIRVTNPSSGVAHRVRVCDRLPGGLVFVSAQPKAKPSQGRRCWTIRRLDARKARTLRVTVKALAGTSGRKVNTATVSSPDSKAARAQRAVRVERGRVAGGGVTG